MDDLISDFINEASESLGQLERARERLERDPNDRALLADIATLVHTIRGACSFLPLPRLEAVAEAAGGALARIEQSGERAPAYAVALILMAIETIRNIMAALEEEGAEPEGDDALLLSRLKGFIAGEEPPLLQDAPAETPVAMEQLPEPEAGIAEATEVEEATPDIAEEPALQEEQSAEATLQEEEAPEVEQDMPVQVVVPQSAPALPAPLTQGLLPARVVEMLGELVHTRNRLMQIARQRGDAELRQPVARLSMIASELAEKLMQFAPPGEASASMQITRACVVMAGGMRFVLPHDSISELVACDESMRIETIGEGQALYRHGTWLPLVSLRDLLGLPGRRASADRYAALLHTESGHAALLVEAAPEREELVVRRPARPFAHVPYYAGQTVLPDGQAAMVLCAAAIAEAAKAPHAATPLPAPETETIAPPALHREKFLLLRTGADAPAAVPLSMISRVERVNILDIEYPRGIAALQYRGDLMRLKMLPGSRLPKQGHHPLIVFRCDERYVGLIAESIEGIAEATVELRLNTRGEEFVGSMVIGGRMTDIVDVGFLLREVIQEVHLAHPTPERMDGTRLLLVEDSLFARNLLAPYLSSLGYDVTSVSTAQEALAAIDRTSSAFDAIISDVSLHGEDGVALGQRIRMRPGYAQAPILILAARMDDALRDRCRTLHPGAAVPKNNRIGLIQALAHLLRKQKEAA